MKKCTCASCDKKAKLWWVAIGSELAKVCAECYIAIMGVQPV